MTSADTNPCRAEKHAPWLVFFVGILFLLPSIWSETSITGGDEYMFTMRTPMEMRERGEWITPWLNGEPRLRKPPLVYWAIRAFYDIFGVSVFAARLSGILAGAALAASGALLARELFGKYALLAGLISLSTMGIAIEGRRAMLDLPVAALAAFAVLFFVRWGKLGRIRDALFSAAVLALGVLAKGPVALLFFGTGALAWLFLFGKQVNWRQRWPAILGAIALFFLIALPWPIAMYYQWSQRLSAIMREELTERRFGTLSAGSPISAWAGAIGLVFPWSLAMLAAIWTCLRNKSEPFRRECLWFIVWVTLSAVPFFFMKAFERYMLALVPGQAALVAAWIATAPIGGRRTLVAISISLLCLVSLLVSVFAGWFHLGTWQPILGIVVALTTAIAAFRGLAIVRLASLASCVLTITLGLIYPLLGVAALPKNLPPETAQFPVRNYQTVQPAMLSARIGKSVQAFDPRKLQGSEVVFLEEKDAASFEDLAAQNKFTVRELTRYKTFYSRKAWVRFARADATSQDWRAAFKARSLDGLRSQFRCYLVTAP